MSEQNIATVNMEALNELIDIETNLISQGQPLHFLHAVRCSAHTLNLAIVDALGRGEVQILVAKCHKIVKHLRRPNICGLMRAKGLKMAILDCVTRWNSVDEMVCKFILHQFYVQ